MASMEPSEQEISQVIDFASLSPADDRFLVTQALKVRYHQLLLITDQHLRHARTQILTHSPAEQQPKCRDCRHAVLR